MNRVFCFFILLLVFAGGCRHTASLPKVPLTNDPGQVQLITSDITLFWEMYDREKPLFIDEELNEQYVEPGTPALSYFYNKKIRSPKVYTNLLNSWIDQQYYEDVRETTLQIDRHKTLIIDAFRSFKQIYPNAIFTDIVFVIGALNTGGVVLPNGQIVIAAEMFAKDFDTDVGYLNPWLQSVLKTPEYLPVIAVHELVHLQQQQFATQNHVNLSSQTLLDRALLEGGADFITHLVLDDFMNDQLLSYANPKEQELWNRFNKNKDRRNLSKWLYNGNTTTEKPADLGYYMGFKIAEAYYKKATDKKQAVKDIIQIKDGEKFLEQSGYAETFK